MGLGRSAQGVREGGRRAEKRWEGAFRGQGTGNQEAARAWQDPVAATFQARLAFQGPLGSAPHKIVAPRGQLVRETV